MMRRVGLNVSARVPVRRGVRKVGAAAAVAPMPELKGLKDLDFTTTSTHPRNLTQKSNANLLGNFLGESIKPALPITEVGTNEDGSVIRVVWANGHASSFSARWFADHCELPESRHAVTLQRNVNIHSLKHAPLAASVSIVMTATGQSVRVVWQTQSPHSLSEISGESLSLMVTRAPSEHFGSNPAPAPGAVNPVTWDARYWDAMGGEPTVNCKEMLNDDDANFDFLQKMQKYGFCFVEGAGMGEEDRQAILKRMGPIKSTIFGSTWDFEVVSNAALDDIEHHDTAYTALGLDLHTDGTYLRDPPGIQMFHINFFEGKGGDNVWVDGFKLAEIMEKEQPTVYEFLCRFPVPGRYMEPGVRYEARHPVISLGADKRPECIRFNNHDRIPFYLPPAEMEEFYHCYGEFHRLVSQPGNQLVTPLRPNRLVVTNNWRVLHGRHGFVGRRRLSGGYVLMDDFESALRYAHTIQHQKEKERLKAQLKA